MNVQVEVFWIVTPCSSMVRCQQFRGPCFLCLQGEAWTPEISTCNADSIFQFVTFISSFSDNIHVNLRLYVHSERYYG
jgi:hypothetical protein